MNTFNGRYEQLQLLGRGAFSEVWKVYDTKTKVIEALKIYNSATSTDEEGGEMLAHEFGLMVNASHKNLLRPLYFDVCDNKPYLVLPYCDKGNINKLVGKMTEDDAWRLIRDMGSALAFLHAMNPPILHQDIKPANILMNDNGDFMLTDFGVSTSVKATLSRVSNEELALYTAGTISYMAPERFSRNKLPIAPNDIYSLGSTVYEMLTGDLPFGNDGGLLQKKGAEVPELPGIFSPMLIHTIDACLNIDPYMRPTAANLEELASDAIRFPEVRANIPIFQTEMPPTNLAAGSVGQQGDYGRTVKNGYSQSGYNPLMSGYNQQMSGYNPQMSGYNQQMSGYNQQTSGYGQQLGGQTQMRSRSKLPLYIGIGVVAVLCILAAVFFLKPGKKDQPAPVVQMTTEQRFERAKQMILNSNSKTQATAGRDSLVKLSEEGYSFATFLYSRLMFENHNLEHGLESDEWNQMKKKLEGVVPIDNNRAHELLELAVKQDNDDDNWEALAELGYDYYFGKHRSSGYQELFLKKQSDKENLEKARDYFSRASKHPNSLYSKTTIELNNINELLNSSK